MRNFWVLVEYEYKKFLKRKIVWVTLIVLCACASFSVCSALMGSTYTEGELTKTHKDIIEEDKIAAKDFEGQKINEEMLKELNLREQSNEQKIPNELYNLVLKIAKGNLPGYLDGGIFELSQEELYKTRNLTLEKGWKESFLAEGEKEVLREENQTLEMPFTYHYANAYKQMVNLGYTLGIMQCLFIAICIPLIFADEHQRRTAQLIMCSKLGKKELFVAKTFVGTTFSLLVTLLIFIAMFIPAIIIYGLNGFGAQIQIYYPFISWNITMGKAMCILLVLALLTSILESAVAMVLSDKYRSSTVPMAIITGFLLFSLFFNIPAQYKLLSQIWSYIPTNLLNVTETFGNRMLHIFGKYIRTWETAPVFYLILSVGVYLIAYQVYRKYQAREK